MDKTTFLNYVDRYNARDYDALSRYYGTDAIFENFGYRQQGAEVQVFLQQLHAAMRDTMKPIAILIDGDAIAMEFDDEIEALDDLPYLPAGAMKKGERAVVRMFAFYTTRGDVIEHVRVAGWPMRPAGDAPAAIG